MPRKVRIAQYGTGHGHAAGKARAMATNPDVELVGVFEPDADQRARVRDGRDYAGTTWFGSAAEMLADPSIQAIAIEGRNDESLAMAIEASAAGKHLWYDKPAGHDWPGYLELVRNVRERGVLLQMGYMFRYHDGFRRIGEWARSGFLGDIFQIRAHFSTNIPVGLDGGFAYTRSVIAQHRGGIFYDLAGHMLDQVCWILGRPNRLTTFFRNDATAAVPAFADNTLGVLEFDRAIATIEIAAMETRPTQRRFEVYATRGSAILLEPFEDPGGRITLCLDEARDVYAAGAQTVEFAPPTRQQQYERELVAFVAAIRGERPPDRTLEHERTVQETLLRATGALPGG